MHNNIIERVVVYMCGSSNVQTENYLCNKSEYCYKKNVYMIFYYLLIFQVPITIDVEVPNDLHRLLAGQKRRELMQTYDVHIQMPPNEDNSDIVKVQIIYYNMTLIIC